MNKKKLWDIEIYWEKFFKNKASKKSIHEDRNTENIALGLKKKIKENYINDISVYNDNFYFKKKFSFDLSDKAVFVGQNREMDTSSKKDEKFFGLKKQQLLFLKDKPVYLVDNHNKALFPFLEVKKSLEKICPKEINLNIIHIDAHRDNALYSGNIDKEIDWKSIKKYMETTRVSDYLSLLEKKNFIKNIINITQSYEFDSFLQDGFSYLNKVEESTAKNDFFILSLDIDIFGPEGEAVETDIKVKAIAKAWARSNAVVIATSPGYIKRTLAVSLIEIFTKSE